MKSKNTVSKAILTPFRQRLISHVECENITSEVIDSHHHALYTSHYLLRQHANLTSSKDTPPQANQNTHAPCIQAYKTGTGLYKGL